MASFMSVVRCVALLGVLSALGAPAQAQVTPPPAVVQAQTPPVAAPATPAKADDATLKIGSVVQLQSGGPKMTVVGMGDGIVRTQWFQDTVKTFATADFPYAALKVADDEDDDEDDEDEDEDEDEDDEDEE